jgi:hypothetical protein
MPASTAGKASANAFSEVFVSILFLVDQVEKYVNCGLVALYDAHAKPVLKSVACLRTPQGFQRYFLLGGLETIQKDGFEVPAPVFVSFEPLGAGGSVWPVTGKPAARRCF